MRAKFSSVTSFDIPREDDALGEGDALWHVGGSSTTIWQSILSKEERPWDVIVSDKSQAHTCSQYTYHVRTMALPSPKGIMLDEGVYLASPELCLLQVAEALPLVNLIELMDEFCGSYCLGPGDGQGSRAMRCRPPLTTTERLETYLGSSMGVSGVKAANRALTYAMDNSTSPMETAAEMLLCLPVPLGGRGMPKARMNQRFDIPSELRVPGDSRYVKGDLCLKAPGDKAYHHVDVEYQSKAHHEGADRVVVDSRRHNLLETIGVHVITLTPAELYSARQFDRVAELVAKAIGFTSRSQLPRQEVTARRAELRRTLIGAKAWSRLESGFGSSN